MSDLPTIGGASIEIHPDTVLFQERLVSAVGTAIAEAQGRATITPHANTAEANTAIDGLKERMVALAEYAGLFEAAHLAKDFVSEGIKDASSTQLLEARQKSIFGPTSDALTEFVDKSHKAFFLSAHDAESAAVSFGNFYNNVGLGKDQSLEYSEGLTKLAGTLHALHPELGDTTSVVSGLTRAIEAGTSKGLGAYGIQFSQADIQAKAFTAGLVDTHKNLDRVRAAQDGVTRANAAVDRSKAGDPDAQRKIAEAAKGAQLAHAAAAHAAQLHSAGSHAAESAALAAAKADDHLASVQRAAAPNQDEYNRRVDEAAKAQAELKKAVESNATPVEGAQKAQAISLLLLDQQTNASKQAADASNTEAVAAVKAGVAKADAQERIGAKLLPVIKRAEEGLADFFDSHQSQIDSFGSGLATGFTKVGDVFGFIAAHGEAFERVFGAIALAFSVEKAVGFYAELKKIYELGAGGVLGKAFPNISKAVGFQTPSVTIEAANVNVNGGVGGVPGIAGKGAGAAEGEAAAVGGAAGLVSKIVPIALAAYIGANVGNIIADKLSGGQAADLNDLEHANNPLHLGDFGGSGVAEQLGATFNQQERSVFGNKIFGGDAAVAGTAASALGGSALSDLASGDRAAGADGFGKLSELLKRYLGPDSPAAAEYHAVAVALQNGTIQSKASYDAFRNQYEHPGGAGLGPMGGPTTNNFNTVVNNPTHDLDIIAAIQRGQNQDAYALIRKVAPPAQFQGAASAFQNFAHNFGH